METYTELVEHLLNIITNSAYRSNWVDKFEFWDNNFKFDFRIPSGLYINWQNFENAFASLPNNSEFQLGSIKVSSPEPEYVYSVWLRDPISLPVPYLNVSLSGAYILPAPVLPKYPLSKINRFLKCPASNPLPKPKKRGFR